MRAEQAFPCLPADVSTLFKCFTMKIVFMGYLQKGKVDVDKPQHGSALRTLFARKPIQVSGAGVTETRLLWAPAGRAPSPGTPTGDAAAQCPLLK